MNYRRALVIAMGVIVVFFLIIFLVSHFIQPILPPVVNTSILLMVASLVGAMMFLVHIPMHAGHRFQRMLDTDSDGCWTPIPMDAGHRFRPMVDTQQPLA